MDIANGEVIAQCKRKHRHQKYLDSFKHVDESVPGTLNIHLVVDNYAPHKQPTVKRWLAIHDRWHVNYVPTYSSWLNQVEIWLNNITQRAIRRGTFKSVKEVVAKIEACAHTYNRRARPFAWTATADSILEKIGRSSQAISETRH